MSTPRFSQQPCRPTPFTTEYDRTRVTLTGYGIGIPVTAKLQLTPRRAAPAAARVGVVLWSWRPGPRLHTATPTALTQRGPCARTLRTDRAGERGVAACTGHRIMHRPPHGHSHWACADRSPHTTHERYKYNLQHTTANIPTYSQYVRYSMSMYAHE
jgi:hypothetical protein